MSIEGFNFDGSGQTEDKKKTAVDSGPDKTQDGYRYPVLLFSSPPLISASYLNYLPVFVNGTPST